MIDRATSTLGRAALVAHQGGWDEVLLVAGPIVVIIAVLAVAKRRVDRWEPPGTNTGTDTGTDASSDTSPSDH